MSDLNPESIREKHSKFIDLYKEKKLYVDNKSIEVLK